MKKKHSILILACLVLTIGGCQEKQDELEAASPQDAGHQAEVTIPGKDKMNLSGSVDKQSQLETAVKDLADRLGIPADEINVVRAESVTWRDGSLGCPRKGMSYTQALVPGTLIVLSTGGRIYQYHSGRNGPPVYCASPQAPLENSRSADR